MASPTTGIVGMVLGGISFVLAVVGTAIPYWIYASVGTVWQAEGLWQLCGSDKYGGSTCLQFLKVHDWVKAVRAMEILGILCVGGAGLLAFLKLFAMKDQRMLPKLAALAAFAAGVFMLIGAIVYAAKFTETKPPGVPLHLFAGFGVVIVAGVLAIVSGVVYIIADNKQQI